MRCFMHALSLAAWLASASLSASEFHRVIGSETDEPNRQHTLYADHHVEGEDIYVALFTNGYRSMHHGYQGFSPGLIKLLGDGRVAWRRSYDSELPDFYRIHRTPTGFLAVVQHPGINPSYGSSHRVLEVWSLDANGNRVSTLFETSGHKSVAWTSYRDERLELIFRSAESREAAGLRIMRVDSQGEVIFDRQTSLEPATFDVTASRIYARTEGAISSLDRDGNLLGSLPVPAWVQTVSANDRGDVYLLSRIRPQDIMERRRPYHQLQFIFRSGGEVHEYHAVHDFDLRRQHLSNTGTLWLLGNSDDFASLMMFEDGQHRASIAFHSRLEQADVSAVEEMSDGTLLLLGTTFGRAHIVAETDTFAVRAKVGGDFGKHFQRCVTSPDRIQYITTFLHQKGMIYPRWFSSDPRYVASFNEPTLLSPYYETLPPTNALLPIPDRCGQRSKTEYLAFLEKLSAALAQSPLSDVNRDLMIDIYVKDVEISGGANVDGLTRNGVSISSQVDSSARTWDILTTEVYPQFAEYLDIRHRLYREAGVLLSYHRIESPSTFIEATQMHKAIEEAWQGLSDEERKLVNDEFPRIRLQIDENGRATLDRRMSIVEQTFPNLDKDADLSEPATRPLPSQVFRYLIDRSLPDIQGRRLAAERDWIAKQDVAAMPAEFVMHEAVKNDWPVTLDRALEAGADPDSEACWGKIMLHMAADENHPEIAQVLLGHGANVNKQGPNRETALHIALSERALAVARLLLERDDTDLTVRNSENKTPLDVANEYAHTLPGWVFRLLESRKAPAGGPFRRANRIIAGGASCSAETGGDVPTVILGDSLN